MVRAAVGEEHVGFISRICWEASTIDDSPLQQTRMRCMGLVDALYPGTFEGCSNVTESCYEEALT